VAASLLSGKNDNASDKNDYLCSSPAGPHGCGICTETPEVKLKLQLKKLLLEKGLTAAQLARISGVPRQSLSDWLGGSRPRNLDHVKKVADALKVSIDELCYGDSTKIDSPKNLEGSSGDDELTGVFEIRVRRISGRNKND
jgi:transcriptional regulator with XRE-family HTH domain